VQAQVLNLLNDLQKEFNFTYIFISHDLSDVKFISDRIIVCDRPGSLDASIKRDSVEANDIPGLLEKHPGVRAVACNGATSANYFRKLVLPNLSPGIEIELLSMPSTSPANAGMTFAQKLAAWQRLLDYIA
jgi:hypoxanthine-DNA glycosylase